MSENHKEVQELTSGDDDQTNPQQHQVQINETEGRVEGDVNGLDQRQNREFPAKTNEDFTPCNLGAGGYSEFDTRTMEWEPLDQGNGDTPQVSLTNQNQENEMSLGTGLELKTARPAVIKSEPRK